MRHCARMMLAAVILLACVVARASGLEEAPTLSQRSATKATPALTNNGTFKAAYGYVQCTTDLQLRPSSTAMLAASIQQLSSQAVNSSSTFKVRATHNTFGSSSSFPCPTRPALNTVSSDIDASNTTGQCGPRPLSVVVLMDDMHQVLSVDPAAFSMRVQAQITLQQLLKAATAAGMSIPPGALPFWGGLSLGGTVAAGAHNTGLNTRSTVCDLVRVITWVDGSGSVHSARRDSHEGRALCSGMGLLGIITELELQLKAPSATRVITRRASNVTDMVSHLDTLLAESPHLMVFWRPDLHRYAAWLTSEVVAEDAGGPAVNPNAVNALFEPVPPEAATQLGLAVAAWQADTGDSLETAACDLAQGMNDGAAYARDSKTGAALTEVLGPTNALQGCSCGEHCIWSSPASQLTFQDVELTLDRSQLKEWVADIEKVVQEDLQQGRQRCLPPGAFVFRFGATSKDYLSTMYGIKEPVLFEVVMVQSTAAAAAGTPAKYEWVRDVLEQRALCHYNARPHWGKAFDRTFTHPRCPLRDKYPALQQVLTLQQQNDPQKLFHSELLDHVLEGKQLPLAPGCVLDHSCYCEEDTHCPAGMQCVASRAFPEYKVCKPPGFDTQRTAQI